MPAQHHITPLPQSSAYRLVRSSARCQRAAGVCSRSDNTRQLNKTFYKAVKASHDPGSDVYQALNGITTEGCTSQPEIVEINTVTQGGAGGLQALVSYLPGGGAHATTKLIKWQVVGVDPGFDQNAPLDASGNALSPFSVGQTIKIITEVSNSAGTRTTAPRTIVIVEPVV